MFNAFCAGGVDFGLFSGALQRLGAAHEAESTLGGMGTAGARGEACPLGLPFSAWRLSLADFIDTFRSNETRRKWYLHDWSLPRCLLDYRP